MNSQPRHQELQVQGRLAGSVGYTSDLISAQVMISCMLCPQGVAPRQGAPASPGVCVSSAGTEPESAVNKAQVPHVCRTQAPCAGAGCPASAPLVGYRAENIPNQVCGRSGRTRQGCSGLRSLCPRLSRQDGLLVQRAHTVHSACSPRPHLERLRLPSHTSTPLPTVQPPLAPPHADTHTLFGKGS